MSGYIIPLNDHLLTPYLDLKGGGLFVQKDNHQTLNTRDSGNSTSQAVKPLKVRGYHKTSFHTYNLLNLRTLNKNQRHLPRYWQSYDDHNQQVLGEWEGKTRRCWPYLMTATRNFSKGRYLIKILLTLVRVGHFVDTTPSYFIHCTRNLVNFYIINYPCVWADDIFRYLCYRYFSSSLWLSTLSGYRSTEVNPLASNLTLDTNELVDSP